MLQRGKALSSEKALHILDSGFHLAFGLCPVGTMSPGSEAVIGCKIPKCGIPLHVTAFKIPGENHGFGIVIDNPMGKAAIHGVHWYYSRPPITGLEYEMDMRGIHKEIQI